MNANNGTITNPIPGHDPKRHDQFLICDNCGEDYPCSTVLSVIAELEQHTAELIQIQQKLRSDDDPGVRKYAAYGIEEAISSTRARIAELRGESR